MLINNIFLYSLSGMQQAECFIRIRAWHRFEEVNSRNIQICELNHWNIQLAFCYLLKGWYEICRGDLATVEKSLVIAERILRPSNTLENLCRLDWVWALLSENKKDYYKGLLYVNKAMQICHDRGFRLWQADNYALRGRLYLLQFEKENG